jgi:hypothetical protein
MDHTTPDDSRNAKIPSPYLYEPHSVPTALQTVGTVDYTISGCSKTAGEVCCVVCITLVQGALDSRRIFGRKKSLELRLGAWEVEIESNREMLARAADKRHEPDWQLEG